MNRNNWQISLDPTSRALPNVIERRQEAVLVCVATLSHEGGECHRGGRPGQGATPDSLIGWHGIKINRNTQRNDMFLLVYRSSFFWNSKVKRACAGVIRNRWPPGKRRICWLRLRYTNQTKSCGLGQRTIPRGFLKANCCKLYQKSRLME